MSRPVRLFISYAAKDDDLVAQLKKHLSLLKRQSLIEAWTDRPLLADQDFQGVIDERLEIADIVVLLVTPSFMASSYCYEGEMERALELNRQGEIRVIPVLSRPCDLTGAPFSNLRGLPSNGLPVSKWSDADEAWMNVVQGLRQVVETLKDRPARTGTRPEPALLKAGTTGSASAANPPTREQLLRQLLQVPLPVFNRIVFYSGADTTVLPPANVHQSTRAIELIEYFEARGASSLQALDAAIRQGVGSK